MTNTIQIFYYDYEESVRATFQLVFRGVAEQDYMMELLAHSL